MTNLDGNNLVNMFDQSVLLKVEEIIRSFLAAANFLLVDLRLYKDRGMDIVEILADKERGGITLGECARLNREIGDALEAANVFENRYAVEVSSPGLDRPLRTEQDFMRNIGKDVHFFLSAPVAEKFEPIGAVIRVDSGHVYVSCDSGEIMVPFNIINMAKLVI